MVVDSAGNSDQKASFRSNECWRVPTVASGEAKGIVFAGHSGDWLHFFLLDNSHILSCGIVTLLTRNALKPLGFGISIEKVGNVFDIF